MNAPIFKEVALAKSPTRFAGLGAVPTRTDKSRFVGALQQQLKMPPYNLPTVASVTLNFPGPLTPTQVQQSFGAIIDPLSASRANPPAGAIAVEIGGGLGAAPNQFQVPTLIVAVGWHLSPDPQVFEVRGNAIPTPSTGVAKPFSPDVFTGTDIGDTGIMPTTTLPALLQWAWWTEQAFYHMARAYNLVWQYGSNATIINDSLQYTAYTPGNAQNGSASDSQIDPFFAARLTNQMYRSIGSPFIFETLDRIRQGVDNGTGLSRFRAERDTDLVDVTYGGAGLRSLLNGNHAFRRLAVPWLMYPGIPIGLRADEIDASEANLMRAYLSTDYGLGGAVGPAIFTEDQNISLGLGTAAPEFPLNATTSNSEQTLAQRAIFKGGAFKVGVVLKGFELSDQQASALKDVDIATVVQAETGLQML